MKLDKRNPDDVKCGVFDAVGQQLPFVVSYDTETCEIEMMLKLHDEEPVEGTESVNFYVVFGQDKRPFVAKFVLPGSYALNEKGERL